ncbi:hypothetical protein O181_067494 [Austropuccinia psidii MF-1]|uniref:Uncharacterized protein n=1 Tax=Austropuccinia psidii MF-1 TaxID=1389203 RepID=A0A9Q3EVG8_9BASI|nr:hypothetical protein [Austropuccinia psidii MF-1]
MPIYGNFIALRVCGNVSKVHIPHEPWQKKPIPIPKSILPHFTKPIIERIRAGLYEKSTSSYTSPILCVGKSNGKLRIVHDLQELKEVTIKDDLSPPHIEEFVDAFSERACYGLGDIMGGYDERELDVTTRPLTPWKDATHKTTPRSHQLSSSIPSPNDLDTPRRNTRNCKNIS